MEKIPMTRAGHSALNDELKQLRSVERPAIIAAIAEARELATCPRTPNIIQPAKNTALSKAA